MAHDLVATAINDGRFRTFVTALVAADLDLELAGGGPYTLFAPDDRAFDRLPVGAVERLLDHPEALTETLRAHLVAGRIVSGQDAAPYLADDAEIIDDLVALNGVIHVIDRVLRPDADRKKEKQS